MGAVQDRALVVSDGDGYKSVEARPVLPLCIAFDHRALDFGDVVPFIKRLDEIFDNPEIIRSWSNKKNDGNRGILSAEVSMKPTARKSSRNRKRMRPRHFAARNQNSHARNRDILPPATAIFYARKCPIFLSRVNTAPRRIAAGQLLICAYSAATVAVFRGGNDTAENVFNIYKTELCENLEDFDELDKL